MTPCRGRLGFVTTSFPRFSGDYSGNFVYHMAAAFAEFGYDIDVIVPQPRPTPPVGHIPDNPTVAGDAGQIHIHHVNYMYPPSLQTLCYEGGVPENLKKYPHRTALILPLVMGMWHRIDQLHQGWNAIVSHWLLPSALIAPRIPRLHIPHLAIAHSGDVHLLRRLPGSAILSAAIARRCTAINFVSSQLRDEFVSCLPQHSLARRHCHLHASPLGLPPNTCTLPRDIIRKQLNLNDFTVLFIGRLSPIKGISWLVDAMKRCHGTLIVAGAGELRSTLEQQCRQHQINARFTGAVTAEERDRLLRAADVLVVPSIQLSDGRHEGAPTILAEAMQAGIPVVATATGGIPERIRHGQNGLLVPEMNSESIAKMIEFIQNYPKQARQLTRTAKKDVEGLRWQLLIPQFVDMLRE